MWPRTNEEKARNRNTGFVCFMHRCDAEEAMETFNHTDPFCNGRRMVLRWGKNVKTTVRRGTGSGCNAPSTMPIIHKRSSISNALDNNLKLGDGGAGVAPTTSSSTDCYQDATNALQSLDKPIQFTKYNPQTHEQNAIKVILPTDASRAHFITTVAFYVSKDGSIIEQNLIQRERNNTNFSFLFPHGEDHERIFYRWRVYAFTQGDGYYYWQTTPFQMFYPDGVFWVPPNIIDESKAMFERNSNKLREEEIYNMKLERCRKDSKYYDNHHNNDISVKKDGIVTLNNWEKEQFHTLYYNKLSISRATICQMMSFCFDKSAAVVEISRYIHESFLPSKSSSNKDEDQNEIDINDDDDKQQSKKNHDTTMEQLNTNTHINKLISRLYLISDVLFNSQQPGVRNAFKYRESIQNMSPSIFTELGTYKNKVGRITWNKLKNAVHSVLQAWNDWNVYHDGFTNELENLFHYGKILEMEDASKNDILKDGNGNEITASLLGNDNNKESSPHGKGEIPQQFNHVDDDIDGEVLLDDDDLDGEALDDDNSNEDEHNNTDVLPSSATTKSQNNKEDSPKGNYISKASHQPRGGWEIVNEDEEKKKAEENDDNIDDDCKNLIDQDLDGESLSDDDVLVLDDNSNND